VNNKDEMLFAVLAVNNGSESILDYTQFPLYICDTLSTTIAIRARIFDSTVKMSVVSQWRWVRIGQVASQRKKKTPRLLAILTIIRRQVP